MILLIFAFLAGLVTILSPCILPILPIVLSGSLLSGKHRPLGVITGFIASFTFFAVFSFALAHALGFSTEILRYIAVFLLVLFGATVFVPKLQAQLELLTSKFSSIGQGKKRTGFWGGFIMGVTLGIIWTPCVGPILASVLTLAATSQISLELILITFAYSLGTALPLFFIAYGGKRALSTMPLLKQNAVKIQKLFGVLIIVTAFLIFFNLDRAFQTYILQAFPQYGQGLTSFEKNDKVDAALQKLKNNESVLMPDLFSNKTPAPNRNFDGATRWLQSSPLTLDQLKGKVVLIDFWTYTCINCIRTLPYVTSWYEKYKDRGFVIIGVHTPEFEFEKSEKNVKSALAQYKITYPVVQDNDYKIWNSYNNQYWPAHYLIDKDGYISSNLDELRKSENYKDESHQIALENVKTAIDLCNPLSNLPSDKYDIWKEILLEFDDSLVN
jgi:cytochrome c biogenesis protein CcdA/thiol-disulfide isomerase/thioredoxin